MRNTGIIALREFRERLGSRSFVVMALLGPLTVLAMVFLLFHFGGKDQQHWNVLISDRAELMENKIMAQEDKSLSYNFINDYVQIEDFASNPAYKKYDALVEINEKVLTNKVGFVFYRVKPSFDMSVNIRYQVERRIEELLAEKYGKLSLSDFRKIKQPLNLGFRNVYDPMDTSSDLAGWVGLFFGAVIFVFIFLFGMTILRSVSREKSNRIVEVLAATVHPRALMLGKIIGIGLSALIQFSVWLVVISLGLYFMRETVFIDNYDPSNLSNLAQPTAYNQFVELVFERIEFSSMVPYFLLFFVVGYLFYGAFFAALGAISGSESDGQQFLLPLIALLVFALFSGYYTLSNPGASLSTFFAYFPFTAPVVVMVKLSLGYEPGTSYQLFLSLLSLVVSTILVLALAGRLYKNGLLQFGHSVKWRNVVTWLKMK